MTRCGAELMSARHVSPSGINWVPYGVRQMPPGLLQNVAPVRAITRPFDSKIHPVGAIRANRRLLCATWWLVCAKGHQIGLNLPPLGATCRLYKYRPSATWFRPSSAAVWTTSLLNIYNFDRRQVAPNGGQPGGIWHEVVTNRVPFGSRHCTLGARHYIPVDSNRRIVCAKGRYVGAIWCHLADTWRWLLDASGATKISNILKFSCRHIQIWCRYGPPRASWEAVWATTRHLAPYWRH